MSKLEKGKESREIHINEEKKEKEGMKANQKLEEIEEELRPRESKICGLKKVFL